MHATRDRDGRRRATFRGVDGDVGARRTDPAGSCGARPPDRRSAQPGSANASAPVEAQRRDVVRRRAAEHDPPRRGSIDERAHALAQAVGADERDAPAARPRRASTRARARARGRGVAPAGAHSRTSSPSPTGTVAATSPSGEIARPGDRVRVEAAERRPGRARCRCAGRRPSARPRASARRRGRRRRRRARDRRPAAPRPRGCRPSGPRSCTAPSSSVSTPADVTCTRRDPRSRSAARRSPAAERRERAGRARGEQPPAPVARAATPFGGGRERRRRPERRRAAPPRRPRPARRRRAARRSPVPHTTRSPASTGPAPPGASARSCAPAGAGAAARSSAASASRAKAARRAASGARRGALRARFRTVPPASDCSRRLRSARAASAPSRSTGTKRVLAPGADWATASMSAEITVAIIA